MSTFLAKPNEVERNWYVIDAAGKSLGRVAAQAATLSSEVRTRLLLLPMLTVVIM